MLQAEQILHKRYQLQQIIKNSFTRQTWLAVDLATSDRQLVVIKLLAFNRLVQWEEYKLFEREAQVLKQLNHPQIPQYREYFTTQFADSDRPNYTLSSIDKQTLWFGLVQNYISGYSLEQLIARQEDFSEQQARDIARHVLNILIYLHGLNPQLIHRDIKPSNLIRSEDEKIYLVDFGTVTKQNESVKNTFTVVGTYGYTPIEQFSGRAVPASDLYALGATLIHLLTGIIPAELPKQNLQVIPNTGLSSAMKSWLSQLVEPVPEKRFATAQLALEALETGILSPQVSIINNSGQGSLFDAAIPIPAEIQGWNWGAFLLSPFWLVSNRVWIGLLAWVPIVGFSMAIALGAKGNEWAWKSRKWQSIEQFQSHQRKWAIAGIIFGISVNLVVWNLGILYLLSILI